MCRRMTSSRLFVFVVSLLVALVTVAQSQTEAPRQATEVGAASLTRNFYFIFGGSGSMSESLNKQCKGDRRFGSRLEGAKWAVEQFLPLMPRDVNLGLWVFDSYGNSERVLLGPDNRDKFLAEVQKTRAGGNTPLTESGPHSRYQFTEPWNLMSWCGSATYESIMPRFSPSWSRPTAPRNGSPPRRDDCSPTRPRAELASTAPIGACPRRSCCHRRPPAPHR